MSSLFTLCRSTNPDRAGGDMIEKSGYEKYFTHRTGHGIGMKDRQSLICAVTMGRC